MQASQFIGGNWKKNLIIEFHNVSSKNKVVDRHLMFVLWHDINVTCDGNHSHNDS